MKASVGGIVFKRGTFSQSFSHGCKFYLLPEMSFAIEAQLTSPPSLSQVIMHPEEGTSIRPPTTLYPSGLFTLLPAWLEDSGELRPELPSLHL